MGGAGVFRPSPSFSSEVARTTIELQWNIERFARSSLLFCVASEAALVFLDYHVNWGRGSQVGAMRRLFNIAREDGLASWLGVTQTLLAALTLWLIYLMVRQQPASSRRALGWLVLALFFTYMAVDDGAQLHERLGSTYRALRGTAPDVFPSYAWQVLFVPAFGLVGLFMLAFLWRELGANSSRSLLVIALGCLAAAVGLDFLEGLSADHRWNLLARIAEWARVQSWAVGRFGRPAYDTVRHLSVAVEEAIEMFAISLLWFLFLRQLCRVASELRIRFTNVRKPSRSSRAFHPASR